MFAFVVVHCHCIYHGILACKRMFGFCIALELYNCQHLKLLAFNVPVDGGGGGFTNNRKGSF